MIKALYKADLTWHLLPGRIAEAQVVTENTFVILGISLVKYKPWIIGAKEAPLLTEWFMRNKLLIASKPP